MIDTLKRRCYIRRKERIKDFSYISVGLLWRILYHSIEKLSFPKKRRPIWLESEKYLQFSRFFSVPIAPSNVKNAGPK